MDEDSNEILEKFETFKKLCDWTEPTMIQWAAYLEHTQPVTTVVTLH
jgi:hypothetical protein